MRQRTPRGGGAQNLTRSPPGNKGDFVNRWFWRMYPRLCFWRPGMSKIIAFLCHDSSAGKTFWMKFRYTVRGTSAKTTLLETTLVRTPDKLVLIAPFLFFGGFSRCFRDFPNCCGGFRAICRGGRFGYFIFFSAWGGGTGSWRRREGGGGRFFIEKCQEGGLQEGEGAMGWEGVCGELENWGGGG